MRAPPLPPRCGLGYSSHNSGDLMKRVKLRPGKFVFVSDEALTRAREGLAAFGATPEAMAKLAAFKGDPTIGPRYPRLAKKSRPSRPLSKGR